MDEGGATAGQFFENEHALGARRARERVAEANVERHEPKERPEDALTTSGSPAQERARRAEHEEEEREEKERARKEGGTPPPPPHSP
jgi:hypothetical protein